MPTRTIRVDPELLLEHKAVRVFHMYRDDDYDQGPQHYWFTLNSQCGEYSACGDEPCRHVFDVRELSTWQPPSRPHEANDSLQNKAAWERYWQLEKEAIEAAIIGSIEQGELTALRWEPPSKSASRPNSG